MTIHQSSTFSLMVGNSGFLNSSPSTFCLQFIIFFSIAVGDLGELEPRRGSAADFLEYHKENVAPLNKKLRDEYESDLKKWFSTNSSLHSYSVKQSD